VPGRTGSSRKPGSSQILRHPGASGRIRTTARTWITALAARLRHRAMLPDPGWPRPAGTGGQTQIAGSMIDQRAEWLHRWHGMGPPPARGRRGRTVGGSGAGG
jgi:hypothetical protein